MFNAKIFRRLLGFFLLWLLSAMPTQANQCGDPDIYRGGSFHLQPFMLVELEGAKEKQLQQLLKQFQGQWRGKGVEIKCESNGGAKQMFKLEGSGGGGREKADLRLTKKYQGKSSLAQFKLFLKDGLLRFDGPTFTNLEFNNLNSTTLEFSVRASTAIVRHSYWRVLFSRRAGTRYSQIKIERSTYSEAGLLSAEQWNLKRF